MIFRGLRLVSCALPVTAPSRLKPNSCAIFERSCRRITISSVRNPDQSCGRMYTLQDAEANGGGKQIKRRERAMSNKNIGVWFHYPLPGFNKVDSSTAPAGRRGH